MKCKKCKSECRLLNKKPSIADAQSYMYFDYSRCPHCKIIHAEVFEKRMKAIGIKAYSGKKLGSYLIVCKESVYEMSHDANMPNGINTDIGELNEHGKAIETMEPVLRLSDLPPGIIFAIRDRFFQLDKKKKGQCP